MVGYLQERFDNATRAREHFVREQEALAPKLTALRGKLDAAFSGERIDAKEFLPLFMQDTLKQVNKESTTRRARLRQFASTLVDGTALMAVLFGVFYDPHRVRDIKIDDPSTTQSPWKVETQFAARGNRTRVKAANTETGEQYQWRYRKHFEFNDDLFVIQYKANKDAKPLTYSLSHGVITKHGEQLTTPRKKVGFLTFGGRQAEQVIRIDRQGYTTSPKLEPVYSTYPLFPVYDPRPLRRTA